MATVGRKPSSRPPFSARPAPPTPPARQPACPSPIPNAAGKKDRPRPELRDGLSGRAMTIAVALAVRPRPSVRPSVERATCRGRTGRRSQNSLQKGIRGDRRRRRSKEGGRGNVGKVAKYFRPDSGVRKYLVGEEGRAADPPKAPLARDHTPLHEMMMLTRPFRWTSPRPVGSGEFGAWRVQSAVAPMSYLCRDPPETRVHRRV